MGKIELTLEEIAELNIRAYKEGFSAAVQALIVASCEIDVNAMTKELRKMLEIKYAQRN